MDQFISSLLCLLTPSHTYTDTHTDTHVCTGTHTQRNTHSEICKHTEKHRDTQIHTHIQTHRDMHRHRYLETNQQSYIEIHPKPHSYTQRDTCTRTCTLINTDTHVYLECGFLWSTHSMLFHLLCLFSHSLCFFEPSHLYVHSIVSVGVREKAEVNLVHSVSLI